MRIATDLETKVFDRFGNLIAFTNVSCGDGIIMLEALWVDPGTRGLGLGQRILTELSTNAWVTGYRKIQGRLQPDLGTNHEFLKDFYKRAGFEIEGDQIYARLPLNSADQEICFG